MASWARSSQTFLECGSVVVTTVAAMGGRGWATRWDWFIVSAPGAGGTLTSVSRASMVKHANGARRVGGGASLSVVAGLALMLRRTVRVSDRSGLLLWCWAPEATRCIRPLSRGYK